jgi:hypothetical protein
MVAQLGLNSIDELIADHQKLEIEEDGELQLMENALELYKLQMQHYEYQLELITIEETEEIFISESICIQSELLAIQDLETDLIQLQKEQKEYVLILDNYETLGRMSEGLKLIDDFITYLKQPNHKLSELETELNRTKSLLAEHNKRYSIRKCSVCDGDGSVVHDAHKGE